MQKLKIPGDSVKLIFINGTHAKFNTILKDGDRLNVVDLRKRALVFEYRILNKEYRIMKFNMIFPYFDISSPDKSGFSTYSNFYGLKKMLKSTTLGDRLGVSPPVGCGY
jgi:hypothetical protein